MRKLLLCLVLLSNACFASIDHFGRYPVVHIWKETDPKSIVGECPIEVYVDLPDTVSKESDCEIVMRIQNTTSDSIIMLNPARFDNVYESQNLRHEGEPIKLFFLDWGRSETKKALIINHSRKIPTIRFGRVIAGHLDKIVVSGNETVTVVHDKTLEFYLADLSAYPSGNYKIFFAVDRKYNNVAIHVNPGHFYLK